ncbi:unnamed protein product [Urochloa decumbens]|uniref:Uncharacterized protein n=1 Tax=Urochloa decumbens TaxID=240449 RepID=A0ABC9ANK3_9POAL
MDVVTGALNSLLSKLGYLLTGEYPLQASVKDDIEFLKSELKSMEAALLKMSEAAPIDEPPDAQDKLWAREVRDLSYDVEDCIDNFTVRADLKAEKDLRGLRSFVNRGLELLKRAKFRHDIGAQIKHIKRRVNEVSERRVRYKVSSVASRSLGPTVNSLRLSALYKRATELIGTEEKSNNLIKRLMGGASESQLTVISIVGFGGLGKTTLAKMVYEKLIGRFDCGAFVCISLNPIMDKVFKTLLYQLDGVRYKNINGETWDVAQLIGELRSFLQYKRYFIVIDDIWNSSLWETIRHALIENDNGSKIISTTRILEVAKKAGDVYQLEPLSLVDSEKLFYQRIFGTEHTCPPNHLAKISENILKKCGGIPLAIITIASMLANNRGKVVNTNEYWLKVYKSIGSGLEDNLDVKNMRRILLVSYYDLPPYLKTCVLYLSLYPEDFEISTEALISKWIGEEFVPKEMGKAVYEAGKGYVDELVNRSMIQPEDIDPDGTVISFRVHDMFLDLVNFLSNEEEFITTLYGQPLKFLPNKIRRLSLQTCTEEYGKQLSAMSLSHVRSLTVSEQAFHLLPSLSSFPFLRVLDLNGCGLVHNNYFKDICSLFHLRYLGLRRTSVTVIPEEIGNVKFLQVLDMSNTQIDELPSTFVRLQQLVYLHIDCLNRIPNGFGKNLKSLQEFVGDIFVGSPTMLHDLDGLAELRRVTFSFDKWDESYHKHFLRCLSTMISLEYLEIHGCNLDFGSQSDRLSLGCQQLRNIQIWDTAICSVPRWASSLSALSILCISLQTLREEDLQVLGSIPSLSHLELWVMETTQGRDKRLTTSNDCSFLCLENFKIWKAELAFAPGSMQMLHNLELSFGVGEALDQFGDFDFGLENLASLVDVSVEMNTVDTEPYEVSAAEAAIQNAVAMNPNKPKLTLEKLYREKHD